MFEILGTGSQGANLEFSNDVTSFKENSNSSSTQSTAASSGKKYDNKFAKDLIDYSKYSSWDKINLLVNVKDEDNTHPIDANFAFASLNRVKALHINFSGASFVRAQLVNCEMQGSFFQHSDRSRKASLIVNAIMDDVLFTNANMEGIKFTYSTIVNPCDFQGAKLADANMLFVVGVLKCKFDKYNVRRDKRQILTEAEIKAQKKRQARSLMSDALSQIIESAQESDSFEAAVEQAENAQEDAKELQGQIEGEMDTLMLLEEEQNIYDETGGPAQKGYVEQARDRTLAAKAEMEKKAQAAQEKMLNKIIALGSEADRSELNYLGLDPNCNFDDMTIYHILGLINEENLNGLVLKNERKLNAFVFLPKEQLMVSNDVESAFDYEVELLHKGLNQK